MSALIPGNKIAHSIALQRTSTVSKTRQLIPGMEPQRLNKTKLKNNDIYRQLHRDVRLSSVQLQLMLRIQLI
jgi:hypothetical protein